MPFSSPSWRSLNPAKRVTFSPSQKGYELNHQEKNIGFDKESDASPPQDSAAHNLSVRSTPPQAPGCQPVTHLQVYVEIPDPKKWFHKPGDDCYYCVGVVPTYKLFLPSEGWKMVASTPKKNANVAGIFVKGASKGASWGCPRNFVAWLGSPPDLPLIKNLKINPLFKKKVGEIT